MRLLTTALLSASLLAPLSAQASNESGMDQYVRLLATDQEQALQTSVVSFKAPGNPQLQGVQVDLVGAIHIADKAYFEQIQNILDSYEIVLYELVADESTLPSADDDLDAREGRTSILGHYYELMRRSLNLTFQLENIDYTREHFVHADLGPKDVFRMPEFSVLVASLKDLVHVFTTQNPSHSTATLDLSYRDLFRLTLDANFRAAVKDYLVVLKNGNYEGKLPYKEFFNVLKAATSSDRISIKTKRFLAAQLTSQLGTSMINQIDLIDARIVRERNEKVMDVLDQQLAAGHKRIAIFYGAAHMPDMAERLSSRFGFEAASAPYWVNAWDLELK